MTPHSNIEDDHDGDNRGKGHVQEGDGSCAAMLLQLKEKEEEVAALTKRLKAMTADLEIKKLELRCKEQRYIDKEYECEKIKEIRDQMIEIKDRELQEAKTLAENLQHPFSLLNKSLEDSGDHSSMEEAGSDIEDSDPIQRGIPSFSQGEAEGERSNPQEFEAEGSDVCPFCIRTIDAQTVPFHLNNCPDSQKWHGEDTNHSDHYQRIICR